MPNLLLISQNDDLRKQISLYAPELTFITNKEDVIDIVILDEGQEQIKNFEGLPIILLTKEEKDFSPDILIIKKPFSLNSFLEKISTYIKIFENNPNYVICWNNYKLFVNKKEIYNFSTKENIKLTEKEVEILKYLYKTRIRTVSKTELLEKVWGYNPDISTHTIETHIYRLRQKVESAEENLIKTSEGGYSL